MQTSDIKAAFFSLVVVTAAFASFPSAESVILAAEVPAPLLPDTGIAQATTTDSHINATSTATPTAAKPSPSASQSQTPIASDPVTLTIPSLHMQNPVVGVGTNSKGEMDVPNGSTDNVGWYKYGTQPGQVGSAVLDAHVFAAFSKIKNLNVDSTIQVTNNAGQTLTFRVEEIDTYKLADVPAEKLFNRDDQPRLNLITCAGKLTADHTTYDHRFVAYAVLVT